MPKRVAAGDHILLGGDNMDLALARLLQARLKESGHLIDTSELHAGRSLPQGMASAVQQPWASPASAQHRLECLREPELKRSTETQKSLVAGIPPWLLRNAKSTRLE